MGLDDFPRTPLLFGPSPIHRLERLTAHLGGKVHLWAKRDDCNIHNGRSLIHGGTGSRSLTNPGVASTRSSQAATCVYSRGSAPASAPQWP